MSSAVAERDVVARHRLDRLQHRRALARQRRLLDLERGGDEQPPVGRDLVAGLEGDDVARARAPRRGCRPAAPPRRTCALISSIFWSAATLSAALPSWFRPSTALSTVRPMITMPGRELLQRDDADDRGAEQHELHQVAVLAEERLPAGLLLRLRELVRAVLRRGAARPRRRSSPERGSTSSRAAASSLVRPCQAVSSPAASMVSAALMPEPQSWAPPRDCRRRRRDGAAGRGHTCSLPPP